MSAENPQVQEDLFAYATENSGTEHVPSGYKHTEVGVIPEDWKIVPLSELLDFRNGVNADKSAYGRGTPFINVLEIITCTHLRGSDIPGLVTLPSGLISSYAVHRGDILFNRTSETQEELALASVYLGDETVVFGGFVIRGRSRVAAMDVIYSGYAFRSPLLRSQIISKGQGAVRANIGQQELSRAMTVLPPLSEQRAIAAALSEVDDLISALDKLIAKKRALKTAAMQRLLTGERRLPGFSGEWETKSLEEVAYVDSENLTASTDPDYQFNYISLEDVDAGTLRNFSYQRFSSSPSRARRRLRAGDVLVSTVRPNLKSHLLFSVLEGNWVCSTGFSLVRCKKHLASPSFVYHHLFHGVVPGQIETLITGSNYPAISAKDVRAFQIPTPSLEEQTAIAEVLSDMDAEIEALEARREKTRDLKQGMMQELLTGRTRLV